MYAKFSKIELKNHKKGQLLMSFNFLLYLGVESIEIMEYWKLLENRVPASEFRLKPCRSTNILAILNLLFIQYTKQLLIYLFIYLRSVW